MKLTKLNSPNILKYIEDKLKNSLFYNYNKWHWVNKKKINIIIIFFRKKSKNNFTLKKYKSQNNNG